MAQTLTSSTSSLCPVSEFVKRVDKAAVSLLASDIPGDTNVILSTNANIAAALMTATGMFESAVMMGGKYSSEDLELMKTTTCGAQGLMFGIISDLAWVELFKRRPNMNVQPPPSLKQSMEWLDMLAMGKRIFAFQQATDATIMERIDSSVDDINARNGVVTQAEAYYGRRADRNVNLFGQD